MPGRLALGGLFTELEVCCLSVAVYFPRLNSSWERLTSRAKRTSSHGPLAWAGDPKVKKIGVKENKPVMISHAFSLLLEGNSGAGGRGPGVRRAVGYQRA